MDVHARPVGAKVAFEGAAWPDLRDVAGNYVRLEAVDPERHGHMLWQQMRGHDAIWDYLFEDVPADEADFIDGLSASAHRKDWEGYAICLPDSAACGYAFYLNISPQTGSIEVGNVNFSPVLQQSRAASEAMYLMMREAFSLGYRRYEWKCNALNMPSRRAAQRFGFSYEGVFRQHMVVKGRNRDTAWFGITDQDWPAIKRAFETWLAPQNFDAQGQQRQSLRALTGPHLAMCDPAQTG